MEGQPRYPGGGRIWSGAAGDACQPSAIPAQHLRFFSLGSGHSEEDPALQRAAA